MNRRELLLLIGAAAISRDLPGAAQTSELLLRTPGLEHSGNDRSAIHGIGLDHITLLVSDLERSTLFYRKFFGQEASRTKTPARVWFKVANTRLGLEAAPAGQSPRIDHFCFNVAGFDRRQATGKLRELGAEPAPSNDEQLLRFRDPNGIVVELKAG